MNRRVCVSHFLAFYGNQILSTPDWKWNLLLKVIDCRKEVYNVNFDLLKQPTLHFITEVRRCHRMRPHIHGDCFSHLFNKDAIFSSLPRLDLFFLFFYQYSLRLHRVFIFEISDKRHAKSPFADDVRGF